MKKIISLFVAFVSLNTFANSYLDENVHKLNWNGVEVVWLEDETLPTYNVTVYFAEGALGDSEKKLGQTEMMFSQLSAGTKKLSREEIIESLEFFGTSFGSRVTHEFSTFSISGLVKDLVPSMKMVCEMFDGATFPNEELVKSKKMAEAGLKSIVSKHSELAKRAFRFESLRGSGYENPTSGTLNSIKNLSSEDLQARLSHFNKKVFKRIYVKGPKEIKSIEKVIGENCHWKETNYKFPLKKVTKKTSNNKVILVPVKDANQAQVQVGRIMTTDDINKGSDEAKAFASNYLGGGFTSRLIQVLRVQKGLTYSAGAYISEQQKYGRSGVITFTKNNTIVELLQSIQDVLRDASRSINMESFVLSKKNLVGNYLLGLESTSDFLSNLLMLDHIGKSYDQIYTFTDNVQKLKPQEIESTVSQIFGWKNQTVLIVGNASLLKTLTNAGYKVEVKRPELYL